MKLPAIILVSFLLQLMAVAGPPELPPPCKAHIALFRGGDGKPLWLKTPQLLSQANHCEAPRFPPQARTARIEGTVILSILVDQTGEVACIKSVTGHPLLLKVAIDAATKWKFKPMSKEGKPVGYYGILEFHFSSVDADAKGNSCLDARWYMEQSRAPGVEVYWRSADFGHGGKTRTPSETGLH